ncbi:hypothetical protein B0A50_03869 [Salinomyces thailandicus]|uniref:Gfo/Idh/MocA-like oxidoreductase N-terminal domain-containing protein n=1 Tax=Salinomyces thailandicus TaxID=706561 RepID=A0A4U0U1R4_9PEZI|nr:hypothetical protein B0A50_03869 [Salinomyces thailandica]
MAPLVDDTPSNGIHHETEGSDTKPRFLIIGAGSRGNAYAAAIVRSGLGIVSAIAEPDDFKRHSFGQKYIWGPRPRRDPDEAFTSHHEWIQCERQRRSSEVAGFVTEPAIDGVFVCVRDDLHASIVTALAPLGLHIMCEKPLATALNDCLAIQRTVQAQPQPCIFAIGHVLRYSPHNMLLRHLLLEQKAIGEVLSMEHTEPVGYWHFSHSYVRGQWRKESTSAPSLLTKSCHDIDFILWMLCSATPEGSEGQSHLPSTVSSVGSLKQFRRSMKPKEAGSATNCLACPIKDSCLYSASKIYYDRHLAKGITKWPVDIVNPEIPHILQTQGKDQAKAALLASLSSDYDAKTTPVPDIEDKQWYGRCVWESSNDVCDDQTVTLTWDDVQSTQRGAKTAVFHMIAQTLAQCERRGRIYGTAGEISYDSKAITVHNFVSGETQSYEPEVPVNSHHGGGDDGLTECFVRAVRAVKDQGMGVREAQEKFLGCSLEDVIRSHAMVFAAEEARTEGRVVEWDEWWRRNVVDGK